MRRTIFAVLGSTALVAGAAFYAQDHAEAEASAAARESAKASVVGSLSCNVEGDNGFIFGTTRHLDCLFARTDGVAETYHGSIKRFGTNDGYTKDPHVVWLVFASGPVESGALAGDYGNSASQVEKSSAPDTQVLIGDNNKQISLEPVHVQGASGLNVASGVAEVTLQRGT
jgi:hypothetical protein